ncbi:MFS transporter [Bradyrhizobium sp. MOS001]|uniref:MFS transporter n=1 Tax=Bradyrhizobium sp. MOS001 TaxID=2133948 RepID=UPI00142F870D|nr:MFS transporter [Bradyrhizobium sp. MOS001]
MLTERHFQATTPTQERRVWLVVATACVGAFMGQMDASVTQLILPVLEHDYRASVDQVSWVSVIYLLIAAVLLPVFGRLSDIYGRKMFYLCGFAVFVLGSALSGLAPNLGLLICARALQGIGSAILGANSVAIIVSVAGERLRGRALGIQAAVQAVGLCTGPAVGGIIVSELNWRWVFWINVPIGIAGALAAALVIPQSGGNASGERFDRWGAVLLTPALGAFVFAVNQVGAWGLASPAVLMAAVLAGVLLAVFAWWEAGNPSPLISLALFRNASFALGNIVGMMANAVLFGVFFLIPFTLERAFRDTPLSAGFRLTLVPLMLAVVGPVSGTLADQLGAHILCSAGMLTAAGGLGLLYIALDPSSPSLEMLTVALGIFGVGLGIFLAPNNSAIMGSAPPSEVGEAGSVMNVVRALGMSIGIAFTSTILASQIAGGAAGVQTIGLAPREMSEAARVVVAVFCGLSLLASGVSVLRSNR